MPETSKPQPKAILVKVDSAVHRKLRLLSLDKGQPMSDLVRAAIDDFIRRQQKGAA